MQINARPHINGNSLEDFFDAYRAISNAMQAIDEAAHRLSSDVTHGRNYQHLPAWVDAEDALIDDRRAIHRHLSEAKAALGCIASALADVTDDI